MKLLFLVPFLLPAGFALALPQHDPVPGGIAIVPIVAADSASFRGAPVMVAEGDDGRVAVVGLPLSLSPGEYKVMTPGNSGVLVVVGRNIVVEKSFR